MAGIYIHFPFCRKKCYYCDFYKTTKAVLKPYYLSSLLREMEERQDYIKGEKVETVYFGGGTPSLLNPLEIDRILGRIWQLFGIEDHVEITLEANPDDISGQYLKEIKSSGVNRLSIGVQSFIDDHLITMNRRHNADQALRSIEEANNKGFDNLSIDLIMGIPGMTRDQLKQNLELSIKLPLNHLSVYFLTYHKGTRFYNLLKKGLIHEVEEEEGIGQFNFLLDFLQDNGFEHYEISNFARGKLYSKHNTSYWRGANYLGLGPAAHSFNGHSRQWNVSDIKSYISKLNEGGDYFRREKLTINDKYNEYLMTGLRTIWGVDGNNIREQFGDSLYSFFRNSVSEYIERGFISAEDTKYVLTRQGILISDKIIASMFRV